MATSTHTRSPARPAPSPRARSSHAGADASRTVSSRPVDGYDTAQAPRRTASVLPVLLAFAGLAVLAVVAAYFGREAITFLGAFLKMS